MLFLIYNCNTVVKFICTNYRYLFLCFWINIFFICIFILYIIVIMFQWPERSWFASLASIQRLHSRLYRNKKSRRNPSQNWNTWKILWSLGRNQGEDSSRWRSLSLKSLWPSKWLSLLSIDTETLHGFVDVICTSHIIFKKLLLLCLFMTYLPLSVRKNNARVT